MLLFFALCFVGVAIAGFCAFVIFWPLTLVHVRDRHAALGDARAAYFDYRKAQELDPDWALPAKQLTRFTVSKP